MAEPSSAWSLWSQYLAARLAASAVTAWPVDHNLRTAELLGEAMHRFDKRHRRRAREHVAACFPEWSDDRIDRTVRASFTHFCRLLFEVLQTPRVLQRASWSGRVHFDSLGPSLSLMNKGEPCLMLTGHVGNWEVFGFLLALMGYRVDALARPIDNRLVNDWLMGIREQRGLRIITKWQATERMLATLDAGGSLAFIADQNAGDRGLFVPFFGRLASSYKSIGLLAMTRQVPIVCGAAHRVPDGDRLYRFELSVQDVITPDDWADRPDPLYYITARYNRAMEAMVRRHPEQYLWMHRRWKSRPPWERKAKPMPPAARRRLADLPWMTDDQIETLARPAADAPAPRPS
ncbi:MAG: lysophospholipid acyltransferase family protein [Planctomycetota bacterium]